jgi:DNA invertase Pin-like site-specific DNA recombinase
MKLKSSKEAEEINQMNVSEIMKLKGRLTNPNTSPAEKEKIRKIFQKIVEYADSKKDSVLFKAIKDLGRNK